MKVACIILVIIPRFLAELLKIFAGPCRVSMRLMSYSDSQCYLSD